MARSRGRAANEGFSLVEVAAAIVALTVIMGGIVAAQVAAANLTRTANDTHIAVSDARAVMEELLLLPIDDIPDEYPDGVALDAWDGRNLSQEVITPSYPNMGGTAVPDPLEIRVTVTWDDHAGRPRSLVLNTVKVR